MTLVFLYTTVLNVIERPDGLRIATLFILGILAISLVSRVRRSFEVRATSATLDATALQFLKADAEHGVVRVIADEPDNGTAGEYKAKNDDERRYSHIPRNSKTVFLEVHPSDSSDFEEDLVVTGESIHGFRVLKVASGNVPSTIAAA